MTDAALKQLQANKDKWAALPITERITILDEITNDFLTLADEWVTVSLAAKGFTPGGLAEAEEWLFVASILRAIRLSKQSLRERVNEVGAGATGWLLYPFFLRVSSPLFCQIFT